MQPRAREGADRPLEDDLREAEHVHQREEREADLQHRDEAPLQEDLLQPGLLRGRQRQAEAGGHVAEDDAAKQVDAARIEKDSAEFQLLR